MLKVTLILASLAICTAKAQAQTPYHPPGYYGDDD
jgi:hypothetical protein